MFHQRVLMLALLTLSSNVASIVPASAQVLTATWNVTNKTNSTVKVYVRFVVLVKAKEADPWTLHREFPAKQGFAVRTPSTGSAAIDPGRMTTLTVNLPTKDAKDAYAYWKKHTNDRRNIGGHQRHNFVRISAQLVTVSPNTKIGKETSKRTGDSSTYDVSIVPKPPAPPKPGTTRPVIGR